MTVPSSAAASIIGGVVVTLLISIFGLLSKKLKAKTALELMVEIPLVLIGYILSLIPYIRKMYLTWRKNKLFVSIKELERDKGKFELTLKKILNKLPPQGANFERQMKQFHMNKKNKKNIKNLNALTSCITLDYIYVFLNYAALLLDLKTINDQSLLDYNNEGYIPMNECYIEVNNRFETAINSIPEFTPKNKKYLKLTSVLESNYKTDNFIKPNVINLVANL